MGTCGEIIQVYFPCTSAISLGVFANSHLLFVHGAHLFIFVKYMYILVHTLCRRQARNACKNKDRNENGKNSFFKSIQTVLRKKHILLVVLGWGHFWEHSRHCFSLFSSCDYSLRSLCCNILLRANFSFIKMGPNVLKVMRICKK